MALRDEVRAGILSSKDENVVSSNFAWFQIFIGSIGAGLYFQSWGIGLLSIVVFGFVLILFAKIFVWLVGLAVFGFVWWVNGFEVSPEILAISAFFGLVAASLQYLSIRTLKEESS